MIISMIDCGFVIVFVERRFEVEKDREEVVFVDVLFVSLVVSFWREGDRISVFWGRFVFV